MDSQSVSHMLSPDAHNTHCDVGILTSSYFSPITFSSLFLLLIILSYFLFVSCLFTHPILASGERKMGEPALRGHWGPHLVIQGSGMCQEPELSNQKSLLKNSHEVGKEKGKDFVVSSFSHRTNPESSTVHSELFRPMKAGMMG